MWVTKVLSSAALWTSPVVVPNPLRRPGPAVGPTFLAATAVQPPVPTPLVAAVAHVPAATSTTLPTNTTVGAVATAVLPTVSHVLLSTEIPPLRMVSMCTDANSLLGSMNGRYIVSMCAR